MRGPAAVLSVVLAIGVGPVQVAVPYSLPAALLQEQVPQSDFDGDGLADLAVGVPGENVGTVRDATHVG